MNDTTDGKTPRHWASDVHRSIAVPALMALLFVGVGLGGFLVWAATAPLAGAVIASGQIMATGENQTVQHLEGGIVKALHVKEGDVVSPGQSLITLDPTLTEAQLNRARKLLVTLRAEEARALAENRDFAGIDFPPELLSPNLDPSLKDFVEAKVVEFDQRMLRYRNDILIMEQRLGGLEQEITGADAQRIATKKQIEFVQQELHDVDYLFQKGLARQEKLFALKRTEAELEGRDGALLSSIGKARQSIAEVRQQIEKVGHDRRTEAGTRLSEVRTRIADTIEQIVASESILSRMVVRAPVAGTIVRINFNTVGGVISPGQALLEILPGGVALVVDARLQLNDIEAVYVGRAANVRLSALNQRITPVVPARVEYVSADKLTDRATQNAYYRVRLAMELDGLSAKERDLLSPSMPAEAFITTGERTMLRYLFKPIEESLARALREE